MKGEKEIKNNESENESLTEIEFLEYMSKKAKTVHEIVYPDGSKGKLNKGVIVLL